MKTAAISIILAAVLFTTGCAHYPVNSPLESSQRNMDLWERKIAAPGNSDSLLVIVAFSGGGLRAAALSYGVLEQLSRAEIIWEGKRTRLLDEIDMITAVSGGSFTAAYYGLFGERIFEDFESRLLKRNIQKELADQLLIPANWFRLASEGYDRVDLAADYFDKRLFARGTFADMWENSHPIVVINATDLASGARFEFTPAQFDPICSDIAGFPVARAVTASAAFPFLFTPIRLRSYAGRCGYRRPTWIDESLGERSIFSRRYHDAWAADSYLDTGKRPFVHLWDGGIADNLGLRGLLRALSAREGAASILDRIGLGQSRRIIFFVVNSERGPDLRWSRFEKIPSSKQVFRAVTSVQINRYNLETVELFRERLAQRLAEIKAARPSRAPDEVEIKSYVIEVSFDHLRDEKERAYFKELPTNFNLPGDAVERVRGAAAKLLDESETYQELLRDLR